MLLRRSSGWAPPFRQLLWPDGGDQEAEVGGSDGGHSRSIRVPHARGAARLADAGGRSLLRRRAASRKRAGRQGAANGADPRPDALRRTEVVAYGEADCGIRPDRATDAALDRNRPAAR